jgi:hypothetical protein
MSPVSVLSREEDCPPFDGESQDVDGRQRQQKEWRCSVTKDYMPSARVCVGQRMGQFSIFARKKKRVSSYRLETLGITGRGGGIRTRDPLHPMQVRYQAALRPDSAASIAAGTPN